ASGGQQGLDDPVRSLAELVQRLATDDRVAPDGPAGNLLRDVDTGPALVHPVVPLAEIVVQFDPVAEPGEARGLEGPREWAGQDARERSAGQGRSELTRCLATGVGERDVRSAGVAAGPRPVGLAVADDHQPG